MKAGKPHTPAPTGNEAAENSFPIVTLGASAGGLEALQNFFDHMPPDSGMAFVVIQHLSPNGKSMLGAILRKHTQMEVLDAEDEMRVEPNRVHLNPAGKDMGIFNGVLQMTNHVKSRGISLPIDYFLRSLALDQGERALCVILSGTGSDGTLGLKAIKESGGMTIVQDPASAKYDGMPRSAIEAGFADHILPVERIPQELLSYVQQPYLRPPARLQTEEKQFAGYVQKILMLIRSVTGRDFTGYKHNTIHRRIRRRMAVHKIEHAADYLRYLQENNAEIYRLFRDLLILVTSFFRDPSAFDVLAAKAIPQILANHRDGSQMRVWVPGCATGEEAISISMLFLEAMDKLNSHIPLQVFATDVDPEAIQRARIAEYPETIISEVSQERLERFFVRKNGVYGLKKTVRDSIVFAVQDVVADPPFSRLDLVSCRNLLIYMDAPLQKKIMDLFHFTLNETGYLFLGISESIGEFSDLFSTLDAKAKVYKAKKVLTRQAASMLPPANLPVRAGRANAGERHREATTVKAFVEKIVLDEYAPVSVLINDRLEVVYSQGPTERYLLYPKGEPTSNIFKIIPAPLCNRLPSAVNRALLEGESCVLRGLRLKREARGRAVDVTVRPLCMPSDTRKFVLLVFTDRPYSEKHYAKKSGEETDASFLEMERELQATRENLHATIEGHEAVNEELKSANEELQSMNEELQSMNEEMETAKEELQSTNEELVTVNSELQAKIDEMTDLNNDINNLLASTEIGTIFLNTHLGIKRFTPTMTKIFSLIPADVGRPIRDLTAKISYPDLYKDAQTVLDTLQAKEIEVKAEDGRWFLMRILPYRTKENIIDGVVITFIDVTERKLAGEQLRAAKNFAERVVEAVRVPLLVLDTDLNVLSVNEQFCRVFRTTPAESENRRIYDLGNEQWNIGKLRELLERIVPNNSSVGDFEVEHDFPGIGFKKMSLNANLIPGEGDRPGMILLSVEDVTVQSEMREELRKLKSSNR
ncbi:MAG: PAS domain-containing protein [Desulfobacteraceae bacterium]|nr:PAS domain-containing protein [Desulfobacteraceae bacterium]